MIFPLPYSLLSRTVILHGPRSWFFRLLPVFWLPVSALAAVDANVVVQTDPSPQVTITWNNQGSNTVEVVRRPLGELGVATWTSLDANASSPFVDTNVVDGESYEYSVRSLSASRTSNRLAHLVATINAPLIDERGAVLLVVEDTWTDEIAEELKLLELNLVADGWVVERLEWNREGQNNGAALRAEIQAAVAANPDINSLFLFGAVEMVKSGWIAPDGHAAHAHETDLFYGDIDGQWDDTANSGNYVAGDGVYDESYYPSDIELRTGRVTFHSMSAFKKNEVEYLRDYIHKEHSYRNRHRDVTYQAYVGDEYYLYATNATIKPIVGPGNWTASGNLDTLIHDESYIIGVGNRTTSWNEARDGFQKGIFTACFRSHIQEWWSSNNSMRGMLTQPDWGFTALWGARPAWYLHKLAAGRSIGQAVLETQNDLRRGSAYYIDGQYEPGRDYEFFSDSVDSAYVSNNLMGDPTLRIAHVEPVSDLTISRTGPAAVELAWTASPDSGLIGYHVYSSNDRLGPYARLTPTPITDLAYSAPAADGVDTWFQVRTVADVTVPTGVYEEQSHGRFALAYADGSVNTPPTAIDFEVVGKINTPLHFTFPGSDVDDDTLTPILIDNPDNGQIRWWEGQPYYVSKRDTPGTDTATYVIFDGVTVSEPATITFTATETGDTLLGWEFPDGTTTAQAPSYSQSHISSTAISGGPGTNIISSWPGTDAYTSRYIGASLSETEDYFEWTVTPESGYRMHLSRINLGICGGDGNIVGYELRASDDGFATYEVVPMEFGSVAGRGMGGNAGKMDSADCSGVAVLQNQSQPVDFRLHWWTSGGGGSVVGLGKITDPVYYDAIEDVSIRGTMTNEAGYPAIIASMSDISVDEGSSVDVLVALTAPPSGPVTLVINKASGSGGLSLSSSDTLNFDSANWNIPQAVTFAAAADADVVDSSAVFEITAANYTTLTFNVTEIDTERGPVASEDSYSLVPNSSLEISAPGVLSNDSDANGDPLTAHLIADVSHGSLTLNADGSFSYTPDSDFIGEDSFTYEADDGDQRSSPVVVSILVSYDSLLVSVFGQVSGYLPEIYSSGQYTNGSVAIEDGARRLKIMNNGWYMIDLNSVEITADTVLEFDFTNPVEGEIHGIYLDGDASDVNPELCFQFAGSQDWGDYNSDDYDASRPNTKHYAINIGASYTGTYRYLVFVQDHDDNASDAVSTFANIRIYNPTPTTNWADAMGLDPFGNYDLGDDANGDGKPNAYYFALDGNPLSGESSAASKRQAGIEHSDGSDYFVLTIPVRVGASFAGTPLTSAPIDGVVYRIMGDSDLAAPWGDLSVDEITPAVSEGLPALSDFDSSGEADWEYRTFRLSAPAGTLPTGFIWLEVAPAP